MTDGHMTTSHIIKEINLKCHFSSFTFIISIDSTFLSFSKQTGRSKSFYVKRAIAQYMEDMEDTYLAIDRIENSEGRVSMEEAKRILDVDN